VGCFSFYPTKNLGAYGDGGLCFTRDSAIAEAMRQVRMYGCAAEYSAVREGVCSRLDELQAAILDVKLRHLDAALQARRRIAGWYDEGLSPAIGRFGTTTQTTHSYQLYVVRTAQRERLIEKLRAERIGFGIHYPVPIHLMAGYQFLGYRRGELPNSERLAEQILSLPCYPELTRQMVARVCEVVNQTLEEA
jgi:dTDP-4-amino-4,6-dideoxygalactose transaminase